MRRVRVLALAAMTAVMLAGCQSAGSPVTTGAVVAYAPTGGVEGLTAGLAGTAIGRDLAAKDRRAALEAEFRALEYGRTGAPIVWRGRSGRGEVVAGPRYRINDYDCRDYTHTITIKRQSKTTRATACRRPNGTWQPIV